MRFACSLRLGITLECRKPGQPEAPEDLHLTPDKEPMDMTRTILALALTGLTLLAACGDSRQSVGATAASTGCVWNNPSTIAPNTPCVE